VTQRLCADRELELGVEASVNGIEGIRIVFSRRYTVYAIQCALYSIRYSAYAIQYTMYVHLYIHNYIRRPLTLISVKTASPVNASCGIRYKSARFVYGFG
jgi:hypothetical protein